ncbi:hypothetical protein [Micromonospora sp. RV43]|uniref:hypothetical protein n=1 Tax=Micromonospora sp. RV43 TaxID=1661387 RepID=UPI00064BDC6D|nr:hypothetical protein [Micromonospora sp. RV43]
MRKRRVGLGLRLAALTFGMIGAALAFDAVAPQDAAAAEKPRPTVVKNLVEGIEGLVDVILPEVPARSLPSAPRTRTDRPPAEAGTYPGARPARDPHRDNTAEPARGAAEKPANSDHGDTATSRTLRHQRPAAPGSPGPRRTESAERPRPVLGALGELTDAAAGAAAPVTDPLLEATRPVAEEIRRVPVVDSVLVSTGGLVQRVVDPVWPILAPTVKLVVEPLRPVLSPILGPVTDAIGPVTGPILRNPPLPADPTAPPTVTPMSPDDSSAGQPAAPSPASLHPAAASGTHVVAPGGTAVDQRRGAHGGVTRVAGSLDGSSWPAGDGAHQHNQPAEPPAQSSISSPSPTAGSGMLHAASPVLPQLVALGTMHHSNSAAAGRQPIPGTRPA